MTEQSISLERLEETINVFGSFDENIRIIEGEMEVSVVSRDSMLKVSGENAENVMYAVKAIEALMSLSSRGEAINEQNVRYIIELVRSGNEGKIAQLAGDVVCVTAKGKPIKPKTLGQKQYVQAIKNNTVTVWEEANIPSVPGTVSPSKSGWVQSGSDWYYYKSGVKATGWIIDNGVRYYLHEDGKMATGWLKLDGHWYYFYKWGGMAENGWVLDNNVWYYLNADGKMATGWLLYRGSWYYLYRWGGMAQTGWVLDNNVWYYLKDDGKMATGWLYDKGSWYYLRDWGGMIASKALVIDGVTYHFAESGEMK